MFTSWALSVVAAFSLVGQYERVALSPGLTVSAQLLAPTFRTYPARIRWRLICAGEVATLDSEFTPAALELLSGLLEQLAPTCP